MKKILALSVAVAALTAASGAFAADLPSRKSPPAFAAPLPVFTWTGFYAGLNAGAAFGNNRSGIVGINTGSGNNARFTGGGQIGYNYQIGQLVVGLEADINFLTNNRRNGGSVIVPTFPGTIGPTTLTSSNGGNSGNYFGTVRPRIGFAFDRALLYVTGGLAYGNYNRSQTIVATNGLGAAIATFGNGSNNNRVGYTLGGGVEYAITNNWTVKGEYLWIGSGSRNRTLTSPAFPTIAYNSGGNRGFSVVRAGVNYKF